MATQNAPGYQDYAQDGPDGVTVVSRHIFEAGATSGDVVRVCRLRAGALVPDLSLFVGDDVASMTASAGYEPVNGDTAQPAAFITAGSSASSAGRVRANAATVPDVLPSDAYLTVTIGGADLPAGTRLEVVPTVQTVGI